MDKTNRTEMHRAFLIEGLPEPLTRASAHLQIFDNYIQDTRLRVRSVRDPETAGWTRILQQRFPVNEDDLSALKFAEIYLNAAEHAHFEIFEGTEIRKNRYFHEFDGRTFAFDVYMGKLWGSTSRVSSSKLRTNSIDSSRLRLPSSRSLTIRSFSVRYW
jgi:CYTH domain-containing protein